MWALLDIRQGRANRGQFLIFFALFFGVLYTRAYFYIPFGPILCIGCETPLRGIDTSTKIAVYPALFFFFNMYIFFLALLRRLRDTGKNGSVFVVLTVLYHFIFVYVFFIRFRFFKIPFFSDFFENAVSYGISVGFERPFVQKFLWNFIFFAPILSGFFIFFGLSFFRRGDAGPNEYGYPPKGLDFRTMVRATYPPHLLVKHQEQERRDDLLAARQEEERQKNLEKKYSERLGKKSDATFAENQEFKGRP